MKIRDGENNTTVNNKINSQIWQLRKVTPISDRCNILHNSRSTVSYATGEYGYNIFN